MFMFGTVPHPPLSFSFLPSSSSFLPPSSLLPLPSHVHTAVGGIYTVIRSKAAVTTAELGDQYCMIGPYNESCVRLEVEVGEPDHSIMKECIEAMKSEGVKVRTINYQSAFQSSNLIGRIRVLLGQWYICGYSYVYIIYWPKGL